MAGSADLFVVCKKCGSEVSPYITECPYCGTRLRKRAPKLEREGGEARPKKPRRAPRPTLGPLRSGEIPGIAADPTRRPWATMVLLVVSLFGFTVLSYLEAIDVALASLSSEQWRVAVAPFVYDTIWYELAVLVPIGVFGWRLELRHGPLVVVALFLACGIGGAAIGAALELDGYTLGAPGAALGMLAAWALPDLRRARTGEEHDGDLLGVLVMGVVVALMPLVTDFASPTATLAGGLIGLAGGWFLLRVSEP